MNAESETKLKLIALWELKIGGGGKAHVDVNIVRNLELPE